MKRQWNIVLAILFSIIIAVFAVINVDAVEVDYLFGTAEWPLVLVILGSVLMGGFLIAAAGAVRIVTLTRKLKSLKKENDQLKNELEQKTENATSSNDYSASFSQP